MRERLFIGMLAFLGWVISAYFAAVYHNLVRDANKFVPRFCRMGPATCASILDSPKARLFGVPNFDLGILFYTGLLGAAFAPSLWLQLQSLLFMGSIVTVLMGFYLSYVLVFQLKTRCGLCFTSHGINLLIFLLLLATL